MSFRAALAYWLKLGFISFGGPAGQIAIMYTELATYIGWLMYGVRGGIAAGALFVLPSLFTLIGLSWIYMAYGQLPLLAGVLYGLEPAVTALVMHAA